MRRQAQWINGLAGTAAKHRLPLVFQLAGAGFALFSFMLASWVTLGRQALGINQLLGRNKMHHRRLVSAIAIGCWLVFAFGNSAAAQAATPAEQISNFRLQHGEGRVTTDSTLNRIAHDQAAAMAAKDVLDHSVLGSFSSRVAPSGSGRAAENIAYGYDSFPKTLNQWIESSGHRQNLLLHGASRVGIASVKSSTTGRTYWAMVIAGDYEQPRRAGIKENGIKEKKTATATAQARSSQGCRIKIFSLCI